jgi:hypothetical protein
MLNKDISIRKAKDNRIPHPLDDDQRGEKVHSSRELLEFLKSNSGLKSASIYRGRNMNSVGQSAILRVSWFGRCEANSCAVIDQNEENDNLGRSLMFWNQWHSHRATIRNIQS